MINLFALPPRSLLVALSLAWRAASPPTCGREPCGGRCLRPEIILDQTRAAVNLRLRQRPPSLRAGAPQNRRSVLSAALSA